MDNIMSSITQQIEEKNKSNLDSKYDFKFDELQMYFGVDYKINDRITIHIPTIGEILDFGEANILATISPFVSNPTTYRLFLWDNGIDWNKISDYELFMMLAKGMNIESTRIIFGEIDFSKLDIYQRPDTGEPVLYDEYQQLIIDEETYMHIREYIRLAFNQTPKVEKAKGKSTKQSIIDEDRMNIALEKQKEQKFVGKSVYLPLISSLLNHPGFKYKKEELKDVNIVEFMDSVQRLQVYESTIALMSGMYSGFCDTSKMDLQKELNWMRDLHDENKKKSK